MLELTAKLAHKLETFQSRCLRRILGVFWNITNEELLCKTDATSLATLIKRRRWRWLGHVCQMSPDALPKTASHWTVDGTRRHSHPKEIWRETVEKEMKECHLTLSPNGLQTDSSGALLLMPYVPPGMKRIE